MAYKKRTRTPYRKRAYSRAPKKAYKRRASKRSGAKRCVCPPAELTPGLRFALAQIEPFNVKSNGAKIPDSNSMPSIATTDCEVISVATTAGNLSATAFRPAYTWGTVNSTPGASAVTWALTYGGGINRTNRTNFLAAVELTRPVAHAIKLVSSLAPTTTTGFVHIGISNETSFGETTWTYPTTVAEMSGLQHYQRITLASLTQTPYIVINKWLDDTGFRYRAPGSTYVQQPDINAQATFQTDGGWGTIVVLIEGAPASASAISVEHILLTENIPQKNGVFHGTQAATDSPSTMAATSYASSNTEIGHSEQHAATFARDAFVNLAAGAQAQGRQYVSSISGPIANALGGLLMRQFIGRAGLPGVNDVDRLV